MKIFKRMININPNQNGQILVLAVVVVGIIMLNTLALIGGSMVYSANTDYSIASDQALDLAEAGMDKAVASLNATAGSYIGENETFIGSGSYVVSVASAGPSTKTVTATGYVPSKAQAKSKRIIVVNISAGTGVSFNYGMQVGLGGVQMANGASINGSVYSNGNITGGNGTVINGDVYVAGGPQPIPNQQSDCTPPSCADYIFGKIVGAENRQDVAQSFKPNTSGPLNKVSLKLKKVGSPSNPTVRVMGDKPGSPNKGNVIATGTLNSSLITTQYGFVDVAFGSYPNLTNDNTYWVMIHANALDSSNYWVWSKDTLQGYTQGMPKWSVNWQANNPVWTSISGDLGFKFWMGGVPTSISMSNGSQINGNTHANTINGGNGVTIHGDAYYQTLDTSVAVTGTKYPSSADPPPTVLPISAALIQDWQTQSNAAGVSTGNVTGCPAILGPGKIVGNVSLGNGCTMVVKSPVWVTGNFSTGNGPNLKLDPSYGAASGIIMVNGTINFANGAGLQGSGTAGSYMMLVTTYAEGVYCGSPSAISTGNGSVTGILYAPYGTVNLANGATFLEVVANCISMGNSAVLNYQTGLANLLFSSGPSGSYSLIKGTYQQK